MILQMVIKEMKKSQAETSVKHPENFSDKKYSEILKEEYPKIKL